MLRLLTHIIVHGKVYGESTNQFRNFSENAKAPQAYFFVLICGHFTTKCCLHQSFDIRFGKVLAQQKHQFGYRCFKGEVVSADDTYILEVFAGLISAQFHRPTIALGDVYYDQARFDGFFYGIDEPLLGGSITATPGLHDHCTRIGGLEYSIYGGLGYARVQPKDRDVLIQLFVDL